MFSPCLSIAEKGKALLLAIVRHCIYRISDNMKLRDFLRQTKKNLRKRSKARSETQNPNEGSPPVPGHVESTTGLQIGTSTSPLASHDPEPIGMWTVSPSDNPPNHIFFMRDRPPFTLWRRSACSQRKRRHKPRILESRRQPRRDG